MAATLDLNVDKNLIQEGDLFTLIISLNTEGELINTIEGDIKYNADYIKGENVITGNSFVNFWVEKPDIKNSGLIHFSGVTPGGVSITNGEAFKVIFKAIKIGNTDIALNNINLFLNDGMGSLIKVKNSNVNLKIKSGKNIYENINIVSDDKISPDKFDIIRTKDMSVFDNKYFTVFNTVDKGSGIDHYKVCELFSCIEAESPYLLKNQTPFYYIKIFAYDANGNYTYATLVSTWLMLLIVFVLSIALYLGLYIYHKR